MFSQRVVLDQIEVRPNGVIQVRFEKQLFRNDTLISSEYHRTVLPPGVKVDQQLAAVNAHLEQMEWPPVETEAYSRIKRIVNVEHTAGVKKAYLASLRAQGVRFGDEEDATDAEKGKS